MVMGKWIRGLGLTFPSLREIAMNTAITVAVMLAGGAFLFMIDTASVYLFAVNG